MAVCDGVMLDVKAWNEAEHMKLTGMSCTPVIENALKLAKAGKLEEITVHLKNMGMDYKVKENRISVSIDETMQALPLLERFKEQVEGFEVVQGTMDDVFLNACGGEKEYA